jgi:hypothetical protein
MRANLLLFWPSPPSRKPPGLLTPATHLARSRPPPAVRGDRPRIDVSNEGLVPREPPRARGPPCTPLRC